MSLEYALERFPLRLKLPDGVACTMRPLGKKDETRLQKFLLAIPEVERLCIKQPVSDPAVMRDWCTRIDYEENLPLLLLLDQEVIGMGTLHQRGGGWRRHIGLVTQLTHPDFRKYPITTLLLEELITAARHLGLAKLEARFNGERKEDMAQLSQLGFRQLLYLPDYVLDMQCQAHDYLLMGMDLLTMEDYAGAE
jgi:GNAT superfamily N-acetyltransferase